MAKTKVNEPVSSELPELPQPPEHLSAKSQELWRAVVTQPLSAGRLTLLEEGLAALDMATAARERVQADGLMVTNEKTHMTHAHPLLKAQHDALSVFLRTWDALHLAFDYRIDGRVS